jgi:lysophospholipase L1-like esterase
MENMSRWKLIRPPLAAGAVLAGQMARAIYRDDLPTLENQDPSGLFGDPDSPPLRVVFLGDSSVTAPGVEPLDSSWPRQIAMHLGERFHVTAISVAVGGAKAKDVLNEQVDAALEAEPDIVYLSVGSNDALRATPVSRFEGEYDEIVQHLHPAVPAVGLSGVGDLGTIPRLPEPARGVARVRARAIDRAIARVTAKYPRAVKSNAWTVMAAFEGSPDMFAGDLFHANARGHLLFGEVGIPVADKLVDIWLENPRSSLSELPSQDV